MKPREATAALGKAAELTDVEPLLDRSAELLKVEVSKTSAKSAVSGLRAWDKYAKIRGYGDATLPTRSSSDVQGYISLFRHAKRLQTM